MHRSISSARRHLTLLEYFSALQIFLQTWGFPHVWRKISLQSMWPQWAHSRLLKLLRWVNTWHHNFLSSLLNILYCLCKNPASVIYSIYSICSPQHLPHSSKSIPIHLPSVVYLACLLPGADNFSRSPFSIQQNYILTVQCLSSWQPVPSRCKIVYSPMIRFKWIGWSFFGRVAA